ncbi:MAG: hypothetical protein ACLFUQ_01610 [Candidatus Izemoplasmataceae bacterium]
MDEEEKHRKSEEEKAKEDHKDHKDSSDSTHNQKQHDNRSNEAKKKELEKLLKEMKKIEQKQKKQSPKGPRMVKIEFGSIFHPNPLVNFLMYYLLNLVVIYSLFEVFSFVEYEDDLPTILLFVVAYTVFETVFRQYLVFNHFRFVLRTFGFIFFFGYLSIFYILDSYVFTTIGFVNETLLIIFVGMFIVFRYLLAQMVKQLLFKMKG